MGWVQRFAGSIMSKAGERQSEVMGTTVNGWCMKKESLLRVS